MTTHRDTELVERLKKCPFCDGASYRHEADFEIAVAVAIGCAACGAIGPFIDVEDDEPTADDWRKAEIGWDTRTIESQASLIREAVGKLRGLLDANRNMARNRAAEEVEAFLRQLKGKLL